MNRGRPKGQKDAKKRKKRKILTYKEESQIESDYKQGATIVGLMKKYDVSRSAIRNALVNNRVKRRFDSSSTVGWSEVDLSKKFDKCGVYAMILYPTDTHSAFEKVYFGSSVNIHERLLDHLRRLNKDYHSNAELQKDFSSGTRVFKMYVVEECEEGNELAIEKKYLNSVSVSSLYNNWRPPELNEILPFLEKASKSKGFNSYTVDEETGCWNVNNVHMSGYGLMQCKIDEKIRYFTKHRVSYWKYKGEYPDLVRHLCNNKACINPDHLQSGNHRENQLDNYVEFNKEFEQVWIASSGNAGDITEHFGWKANNHCGTSSQVYYHEKKLGFRDKHSDIIEKSKRRRTL